jgi:hypothetical protein
MAQVKMERLSLAASHRWSGLGVEKREIAGTEIFTALK